MKKMRYKETFNDFLISQEGIVYKLYLDKIDKYKSLFEKLGYSIKCGLMWTYFRSDQVFFRRVSIKNKYQCYVYCNIQKDGEDVLIYPADGEVEFYSLSNAWMISCVKRHFLQLVLEIYDEIDDIDLDLNDWLIELTHIDTR